MTTEGCSPRAVCSLAVLLLLGSSCSLLRRPPAAPLVPVRAYRHESFLNSRPEQVAVLPFDVEGALPDDAERTRDALLHSMRDSRLFQVRAVSREELGRSEIATRLKPGRALIDSLIRLRQEYGAQAVLFGTVTFRRLYSDPALGLRLTLVDTANGNVLWVADDVVDSREPEVRESLTAYLTLAGELDRTNPDPAATPFDSFARFVTTSYVAALTGNGVNEPSTARKR